MLEVTCPPARLMQWRWEQKSNRAFLARRRQTTTGTLQKFQTRSRVPPRGLCSFRGSREPVTLELDPWRMVAREATRDAPTARGRRAKSVAGRDDTIFSSVRRYLRGCSVVPATLLAALSLVPMRVAARSVTDACFWDPSDGTCSASATWASQNNLIHSKQGRFMARVLVAYEECVLGTDDATRCRSLSGTCDWRAGATQDTGECYLSAQWMTKELQGCLSGDGAAADPLVQELLDVSVNCLDKSTDKGQCDGMGSRCHWTDSLAEGVPSFCGPNPMHAAQTLVGIDGLVKILTAVTECPKNPDRQSCDTAGAIGCEWIGDQCAVSFVKTLKESVKSPAVVEYLTLLERCRGGKEGEAECAAAGDTTVSCVYGPKRASTNIIPEEYGGDGGDGQGGWEGSTPTNTNDPNSTTPMSCYPSYLYVAEKVAPLLGVAAGEDGACALAEPTFRVVQACDAAKNAGACDAVDYCTWDAAAFGGAGACLVDVDEAISALLPESDADPILAAEDACERGAESAEACAGKSAEAESAARDAGADVEDGGDGDDDEKDGEVGGAGTAGAYFVVAGFVVFAVCFAAPANYVNVAYKRKGKDVCDDLPTWAHKFVPSHLRPEGMDYVQVTEYNPDPDLNVDDL